jgi:hypothetical protein
VALGAAAALASIHRSDADTPRIREALTKTYQAQAKISRMQLLRGMQHLYDPGLQSFFLGVAKAPEEELPDIRVIALNAYSMLANKAEAQEALKLIAADDSPYKANFEQQNKALLEAAAACDQDLACWTQKLNDKDVNVARKAAYMLGRLGRGKPEVIATLTSKIDEPREDVRGDVLYALDFVATKGSPEAVAKIAELEKTEKGRAIWSHVGDLALTTGAHLAARAK